MGRAARAPMRFRAVAAAVGLVWLVSLTGTAAAFDLFLQIQGIDGESTDDTHRKWIDVESWQHWVAQPSSGVTTAGVRRAEGLGTHGLLTLAKRLDKASPALNLACCRGDRFGRATLDFCHEGGTARVFRVVLSDVLVASVRPGGASGAGDVLPLEEVSFAYARVEWTYTDRDGATGLTRGDLGALWDLVKGVGESYFRSAGSPPGAAEPFVLITKGVTVLPGSALGTEVPVGGIRTNLVGDMWWYNDANETTRYFTPAGVSGWSTKLVDLQAGPNTISVCGKNASGVEACDRITILVGDTYVRRPVVGITDASPMYVSLETVNVTLNGTNNDQVVGSLWWTNLTAGARDSIKNTGGNWTAAVMGLAKGRNDIEVYGENAAGELASDAISIVRLPSERVPGMGTETGGVTRLPPMGNWVRITGTNNEFIVGTMWWVNTANNSTGCFPSAGLTWSATVSGLQYGVNNIYVYGSNRWGDVVYQVVPVTRAWGPGAPAVAITRPPPSNVLYNVTSVPMSGTNSDVAGPAIWWENTSSGGTGMTVPVSNTWTLTVADLARGPNVIYVYGTNAWGEAGYDVATVVRDWSPGAPAVAITSAVPSNVVFAVASLPLSGTNNAQVVGSMKWTNAASGRAGVIPPGGASGWSVLVTDLQPGGNVIYVSATNAWGETAYDVATVTRDWGQGPPFVDITNGTPGSLAHTANAFTVAGTNNANVTGRMWWLNLTTGAGGTFLPAPGGRWSVRVGGLRYGDNAVYVYGTNRWNEAGYDAISIARDYPPGTRFVSLSGRAEYPYTTWATAARSIQVAVDAAGDGELVLVADGEYRVGARALAGQRVQNRVLIQKPVRVASVNGPARAVIKGEGTGGPNSIRCALVSGGGELAGFTLSNGWAQVYETKAEADGGGGLILNGGVISNCWIVANHAEGAGGGVHCSGGGKLVDSRVLRNTSAGEGGGAAAAAGGTVAGCVFTGNSAGRGGGVHCTGGRVERCSLSGNSAPLGGGAWCTDGGRMSGCTVVSNQAQRGGGIYASAATVARCAVVGNRAFGPLQGDGGGILGEDQVAVENCLVAGNRADANGGGVCFAGRGNDLQHGSISDNACRAAGGGVYAYVDATLRFSIVYYNEAEEKETADLGGAGLRTEFCCLSYPPPGSTGSVKGPPLYAARPANYRLLGKSPCIDAINDKTLPEDLDGTPRPLAGSRDREPLPDIGAYEYASPDLDSDGDGLPDDWEAGSGLNPLSGSGDDGSEGDPDGDGLRNRQEREADTNPLDSESVLSIVTLTRSGTEVRVGVRGGVSARRYLLVGSDLVSRPGVQWTAVATSLPPVLVFQEMVHAGATNPAAFYRVQVERP